jgi:hypothetical protein
VKIGSSQSGHWEEVCIMTSPDGAPLPIGKECEKRMVALANEIAAILNEEPKALRSRQPKEEGQVGEEQ